jgi:hypothetical protein
MAVPYTFGSATTSIPLSQLDSNFATTITLGNTSIQLGNTVTTLNNMTLANVTISSGTSAIASSLISNGTSNVTIASSGGAIAMATNGTTAMTIDTSQKVSFTNPIQGGSITTGTSVASTSGTSIDFTGIPSWVKRITVMFNVVSTNGASNYLVQIGSGSPTTSGYSGSCGVSTTGVATVNITTGFGIYNNVGAGTIFSGAMTILAMGSNLWVASGAYGMSGSVGTMLTGGSVSLSGTLDRLRITTVNGTDAFDAGSINILYEG